MPLAADHAVGIAVLSYDGKLAFGLAGDERAAPDLEVLAAGIEASLVELGGLCGGHDQVRAIRPAARRAAHP